MHWYRTFAEKLNRWRRQIVTAPRRAAYKIGAAFLWLWSLRVELWCVEGEEQHSRLPLTVVGNLGGEDKSYLLKLMFADGYRERNVGRVWLWNVPKTAARVAPQCSAIVLCVRESYMRLTSLRDWFYIPTWLWGETDLPRDAAATRLVREDLRRIRNHALAYEVTRDQQAFDDFYYNMYLPHITKRYGDCAVVATYERLHAGFPNCDLLLVKRQDALIAGQLIRYGGEHPHLWELGVRDGNHDHVQCGGLGAIYHYCLEYLAAKGYRKVWLGWSRPFLNNGVLQFKKKWSQRIIDTGGWGIAMKIGSNTPAVRSFLYHNGFIFKRQGAFFAAVFTDAGTPLSDKEVQRLHKDYLHDGLSRLLLFRLGDADATPPATVPAGLANEIELRAVADSVADDIRP